MLCARHVVQHRTVMGVTDPGGDECFCPTAVLHSGANLCQAIAAPVWELESRLGQREVDRSDIVLEQSPAPPLVHASATLADPQQPKSSPRSLWDETPETGDLHSAPRWSHSCVLPEIAPGRD